jgi:alkaline phosphatase D
MCSPVRFLWVRQLRRDGHRLPGLRLRPWINPDQWDGYPAERDRLLALLDRHGRHDVLIASGDLHAHFVTGIRHRGRVVPELTTPAVSSPTMAELVRRRAPLPARWLEWWLRLLNRPARSVDLRRHGASVVDITAEHLTVETRWVDGRGPDRARWRLRRGGDGRWERQA